MEEQSSIATAGLLTRSVCDAFPTRKSVARECRTHSLPEEGSRNIQQRELFGIRTRFPLILRPGGTKDTFAGHKSLHYSPTFKIPEQEVFNIL